MSPHAAAPRAAVTVLVHGNGASAETWRRVVSALGGRDVLAPDLPGFGARADEALPPGDPLGVFTDAVLATLATVPTAPVVLVGAGTGATLCGHAALRLAATDPGRVRGVVMVGPVGLADGHAKFGAVAQTSLGAAALRTAGATWVGRGKFLGDQLARPGDDPEACEILVRGLRAARGFAAMSAVNVPSALAGLRGLACPVVVLWGGRDGVLPAARAPEFMTHLPPHARLDVHGDLGHAIQLERPDLVAAAVAELLASR